MTDAAHDKLYSRTEYRRVIAWPERILRETPFLSKVTDGAPKRSLLDVGCGSGEHARHFAEQGWEAVGIDVSEKMMDEAIELAGETEAGGRVRYELRDGADAARLPEAPFGTAICLGNTLAFLESRGDLESLLRGVGAALAPGAPFLLQLLNYERIRELPVRALPVNVRPLPEEEGRGEIVFLRVLETRADGDVDFYPITLTLRPGEEPEVEVRAAKHFVHHAWTRRDLEPALEAAGFGDVVVFGGMCEEPFAPMGSSDLVLLARKDGGSLTPAAVWIAASLLSVQSPEAADAPAAEDVRKVEVLDVSATRLDPDDGRSPTRVERLSERDVTEAAASSPSIAQAVQQLPGVGAVGRDGFTSAPTIRGLGRDRSLILLEGVRLSSDRGVGPTGSFLDPFLSRSVRVVRGASGVAYGSGAIGGVVSIGLGAVPHERHASARIGGSTNGDGVLAAGRAGAPLGNDWHASVGVFTRSLEDYRFPEDATFPDGAAKNSGLENAGGTIMLERPLGYGGVRVAIVGTTADEVGRPTTRAGRLDSIEIEDHLLVSGRWSGARDGGRTEVVLGVHRPYTVNRAERFDETGARTSTRRIANDSWDVSTSLLLERPLRDGSWLAGVDLFTRRDVDAHETTLLYQPGGPSSPISATGVLPVNNASRVDVGVFAGYKRTIGRSGELLIAGRLDRASRSADDRSSVDWIAPSVTLGAVYPLSDRWAATGSVARSFRAPRIQELYFAGDRPGGTRLANPDLDPEKAWSAEAGLRWSAGGWSAETAVFSVLAGDLIVQLPVDAAGDTLRNVNETEGTIAGAELAIRWEDVGGRGRAGLAYAVIHGDNDQDNPLPDIPSGELRLTGEWLALSTPSGREVALRVAMRAGGAKIPFSANVDEKWWADVVGSTGIGGDEEGHPGYARWDTGVRARISRLAVVDVAVSNVFDARYIDRPESNAFPQPGRSLLVELTLGE